MKFLQQNAPLLGGFLDFFVFLFLTTLGATPANAHVYSFLAGAILYYGVSFSFRAILKNEDKWDISQIFYALGFVLMVVSVRGGIVFLGATAIELHPVLSYLPALLLTILSNLLYIRFVHVREEDDEKHFTFFFLAAGIFMVLIRFLYLGAVELIPEEAYYWKYAEHLSPGYIDHPPMVGWLIALGTKIFGMNEFGVRFFGWFASVMAAFFLGLLHLRMFGKNGIVWTMVLTVVVPYGFGAGFFISPDAGLLLFWSAALYFLHRALFGDEISDWFFVGMAVGLGMLSKYTIGLLGLPTIALMVCIPEWRRYFRSPGPYIAACVALAFFLPVIYWNATHEWASFAFQSTGRLNSATQFSLHSLFVDMMSLVTPSVLAAVGLLLMMPSLRKFVDHRNFLFAGSYFVLPASIFVFYSIRHLPKLNWTGPAFLSMLPLVSAWLLASLPDLSKLPAYARVTIRSFIPVFLIWMSVAGLIFHYLGIGLPLIPYSEKMHRMIGWRSMVEAMLDISNKVQAEVNSKPVIVGMDKHFIAAEISFYGTKRLGASEMNLVGSRNIVGDEALMFRFWADPKEFVGKTMILVANKETDLLDSRVNGFFEKTGPIISVPLTTRGWNTRGYWYRIGYRYKGVSAEDTASPVNETPAVPEEHDSETEAQVPLFTPAPPSLNQS